MKRTPFIEFRKGKINISISPEMPFLRVRAPITPLGVHQILAIVGSLLTVPHFLSCRDYVTPFEITGILLGVSLLIENVSGFLWALPPCKNRETWGEGRLPSAQRAP